MKAKEVQGAVIFRAGAFRRRIAWVFALQFVAVAIVCVMGTYDQAPLPAVIAVIVIVTGLAWLATRREWQPVSALARLISEWRDGQSDPAALRPERLSRRTDADLAMLARGLHGFASRIADYGQRERNFTRDASHELRTPLTVIRMAVDMLADETGLGDSGRRSVRRIHRATRELEALVEVLLILARESDPGGAVERFVVNDVLRRELETARDLMAGSPVELQLEEPARFALRGSVRAFSVLCWQLIRDACQHAGTGRVVVTVLPDAITVSHASGDAAARSGSERLSFELAIAQRISDRFAWPLELHAPGKPGVARVRFPHTLPVAA
ncbi:histidine kinase dimerization/phospho-acceptor domain-containing protein [Rhodanobacter aciditrophus]|uniref:histidine kinase dimerization/phospho-acceptor domain-containing protein n=1 Tax=Rhodanobacter aciditrophus TaxID=1623218 RepID=UPI003CE7F656